MIALMWSRGRAMACVLVIAFSGACGSTGDGADHNPGVLYPDRANQSREDQERHVGESAMLGGYSASVTGAHFEDEGRSIRVEVEITNRDQDPQRVDATHWTLVNPSVQELEATSATFPVTELPGDATITAEVVFTVDSGESGGDYYVQYKPGALDAARGIWQVTAP